MNEKKAIMIVIAGMVVLLCLSVFIVLTDNNGSEDETIVIIRSESSSYETATTELSEIVTETKTLHIDINSAEAEELIKLDGIGEATAQNIIAYREKIGGFANIEEIKDADGIGEEKFAQIKDYIYVENPYERLTEAPATTQTTEEAEEPTELSTETTTQMQISVEYPININTADKTELMQLPYVTEEIAEKIISLRESINGFSHPYELLYVEELEQKEVAEIVEFVTVGQ